jgi:hypothetical protein
LSTGGAVGATVGAAVVAAVGGPIRNSNATDMCTHTILTIGAPLGNLRLISVGGNGRVVPIDYIK